MKRVYFLNTGTLHYNTFVFNCVQPLWLYSVLKINNLEFKTNQFCFKIFSTIMLLVCCTLTVVASETGLIVNPSFETGNTTGWTVTGLNSNCGTDTIEPYSGKYKFFIYNANETYSQKINQLVTGVPNGKYTVKCWARSYSGQLTAGGGTTSRLELSQFGSGIVFADAINDGKWREISKTITVKNNQINITYIAVNGGGVNIDSFSLELPDNHVNIALRKPAKSSSIEFDGTVASKAFDGSTATRWSCLYLPVCSDPQWIYVDLGSVKPFNRVKLVWETAFAKSYKIQTSNDTITWIDIYSTTTSDGIVDDIKDLSGNGRYVRMFGTERGTPWGYSMWEFEIYDSTTFTSVNEPLKSENELVIYPNPATDVISVKNVIPNSHVKIFDLTGKMIKFNYISLNNELQINVRNFIRGVYFICVQNNSSNKLFKILLQ